jgi:hypothetical protein
MPSAAFIITFLPAAVLAALPSNITYPRHVLPKGRFTVPSGSLMAKPTAPSDAPQGVFTEPASICMQPAITVTATVTCGGHPKGKPFLASPAYDDDKHAPAKPSKSATVTWWDSTTTVTGLGPWPVTATPTIDVFTQTKGDDLITSTRHRTTTAYAETYSASTATAKLNTTSVTGIVVKPAHLTKSHYNPAALTKTHYTHKTRTSTFVDFVTKTRVHSHTSVPAPYETDDEFMDEDSSDDDAYSSETRLPEHPSVPTPISIVGGNRTSHGASKTKGTAYHPGATVYPQDDGSGYNTPEYKDEDDWVEDDTQEPDRKKPDFYDDEDDEDEDENTDEDADYDVEETTSLKSNGTKHASATVTLKKPAKVDSTKTTGHGKPTSSSTRKPTIKPKPTIPGHQSTAKKLTAITLFASTASPLPTNGLWKTNATSAAGKAKTSHKQLTSSTSHAHRQPDALFTDLPLPLLSYSKTQDTHFPLTSGPFSYKPIHHGHITATFPSGPTTEGDIPWPSATATKEGVDGVL